MQCKLGFMQSDEGQLLVLTELLTGDRQTAGITVTNFSDENVFLYYVVLAELEERVTTTIISNVLLALSEGKRTSEWTTVEASERQLRALGLKLPCKDRFPTTEDVSSG